MATTSLWRVKGRIDKTLLYVENPDKTVEPVPMSSKLNRDSMEDVIAYASREKATNKRQLVSSINCSLKNARKEMLNVKRMYDKEGGTIAYHGYQSFREGEVTPELAHEIGMALAMELWGDRYQVIVATHLDKASHIHNHFVINTVSHVDGIKYFRSNSDYAKMREVSDRLCREHGLSVINDPQRRGLHYAEWLAEKNGLPSRRAEIRKDIDKAILASTTEQGFVKVMKEMGYEFKVYKANGNRFKYPAVKPYGAGEFFRLHNLGEGYDFDSIMDRIYLNTRKQYPFPEADRKPVVIRIKGINEPHKLHGLAALFYKYCVKLHIVAMGTAPIKKVSFLLREDVRKMDRYIEQTRFLGKENISTAEELSEKRKASEAALQQLIQERTSIYNQLRSARRAEDTERIEALKEQAREKSAVIKEKRKEMKMCDEILARSEDIAEAMSQWDEQEREEANNNELLRRRSRAGREVDA